MGWLNAYSASSAGLSVSGSRSVGKIERRVDDERGLVEKKEKSRSSLNPLVARSRSPLIESLE